IRTITCAASKSPSHVWGSAEAVALLTLPLPLLRRGKVREMYVVDDERLLMVASDRVSAFDVVMNEPIPGKGAVLTALSAFWFRRTADVVRNHLISDDLAALPVSITDAVRALGDRWLLVRRAARIDI